MMDGSQTQREIVMKLSAKGDPSLTAPMKEMGKSVKDASTEEQKYQQLLKNRIKDYDKALRLKNDLAKAGIGRELTEEERYQRLFRQRIKDMEVAKRLKDDLAKAGFGTEAGKSAVASGGGIASQALGFLASPQGILAALGTAIAAKIGGAVAKEMTNRIAGQRIAEYGYTRSGRFGIDAHAREGRMLEANAESFRTWLGWIPGLGGAIETGNYANRVSSNWYRVEQNLRESREAVERNQARGEMNTGLTLRRNQLEREAARHRAMLGFSEADKARMLQEQRRILAANAPIPTRPGEQVGGLEVTRRFEENQRCRAEREAAQARIQRIKATATVEAAGLNTASQQARLREQAQKAVMARQQELMQRPGAGGYNRQAALADYEGRIGFQTTQKQQEVENKRQMGILGYEAKTTDRQLGAARQREAAARTAVESQARNAAAAKGHPNEQQAEDALLQRHNELAQANREVEDAIGHAKELQIRQAEMLNEQSVKRIGLLQEEATRLRGIIREENDRDMSRRERFGLMNPMKRRTALMLAQKEAKGLPITYHEQQIEESMPEIFGERLRKRAFERTGKGSDYEKIKNLLPELGARKEQAQRHLANVNQQFHVEIKLNETALAQQIQKTLMPKIHDAINQAIRAVEDARLRAANQQRIQQNVNYGQ